MDIKKLKNQKIIPLRVTPKAAVNNVKLETLENDDARLRVYVTAVPEKGKANKQVIKLVAKFLGIAPSKLEITQGATGKDKLLQIID